LGARNNFRVNIFGLSNKAHWFEFEITDGFFETYGNEVVANGNFRASVGLDKRETFIEATIAITGQTELICDRSLDAFTYPMDIHRKVIFKYGEAPQEISDEIVMITRDQDHIDIGQYLYEFIVLNIPIRKLHPRFAEMEKEDTSSKMIYTTATDEKTNDEETDPRWEKLKKLKK
jgi:uncharacterized protein